MIGKTVSHYRIIEKLGQGGMGEVYRAEDTYLHRLVAIKVLPDEFAHDAERLARFQREAEVLSSLNHPNISTLYGLEESEGKRFIVMELVQGETLSHRLLKGPLPVEEALKLCRQIAEGLEAAHEKGVIHRDLKPSNVMITSDEKIKILDFGLAKALAAESAVVAATQSPTITEAMTRAGTILGTAAYMSPEQAKGKPVDKRADIWAFGCILYECLTGKAPFKGETVTETLAKILEGTPDWNLVPPATPSRMKELLHRCLQRNPRERLHDIGDAWIEMQLGLPEAAEVIPISQRFSLWWILLMGTAILVIGILIGLGMMRFLKSVASPTSQPVVRLPVRLEPGLWLDGLRDSAPFGIDHPTQTAMVLSRDSRFVVYAAIIENPGSRDRSQLYLRRLDQWGANPIAGTEGGICPFLSADDLWVGFWADGKLRKVLLDGGIATDLCDVPEPNGFSWGENDQIYFTMGPGSGLSGISASGGKPETLTKPDASRGEYSHRLPHYLPGGRGILFTIMGGSIDTNPRVAILELGTGRWRVLVEDGADARYVRTGHLAFLRQGTLMTIPFDSDSLEIIGQAVPTVADISQALNNVYSSTGAGQFSVSASGSLVCATGGILPELKNSLEWVDLQGNVEPVTSFKAPYFRPRLSSDDQQIAYRTVGKERLVWILDLNRGTRTRLTSEGRTGQVAWVPGSKKILYGWGETGITNIFCQAVDGSSPMERLTQSGNTQSPSSCTPDGQTLAFVETSPSTGYDVMLLNIPKRQVTSLLNSRFNEAYPEFSPDGRWLAYVSNESERMEVYVQPFPGPGGKLPISDEGGSEPLWARDGKRLFYRQSNQIRAVDVQSGYGFNFGKPRLLFEKPGYGTGTTTRGWDVSLDGKKFLMVKLEERKPQPITEMILVLNWFEELKRLALPGR